MKIHSSVLDVTYIQLDTTDLVGAPQSCMCLKWTAMGSSVSWLVADTLLKIWKEDPHNMLLKIM
jgi:hypothetical protein